MKKNGFTLVELLTVICIIAVIAAIGTFGVSKARDHINHNLWDSKVDLIESKAKMYGEDNLHKLSSSCTYKENGVNVTKDKCLKITVQTLLDTNYLPTKERDVNDKKVIINDLEDEKSDAYYANNMTVIIYSENDYVYAKLLL